MALTGLFNWSQPWAVEYSAYLTAMTLFAGSGWSLRQGAHIRVAVLLHYLPRRPARAVDFACSVFAAGVAAFLTYGLFDLALRSYQTNSKSYFPSATPLVLPQFALLLAVTLLTLALVARAVRLAAGMAAEEASGADPAEDAAQ